ncbi:ribonucleotide reductase inhibitor [Schizosaccharomyces japonicus yFS275]|uniref:Ribonucleotide reductase inhibitor n=1 Tax=Schizosaccharomyces japonicus (strain yFS275 / FY16936) TaxID=402676 RepID=B6K1E9_SCHJY|nr:ribonucleotide reductase inhibitor [Schizosaccharomyces japonicus yFS275]EEB07770.2 ribonucleotide reductase inhibitor [Schizosaccharomyces japonicus yFS275]
MTNSDFYILSQFNEMTQDKQESKDQVPEDVQASLTTVGMRIRQAVTQGYSTKQTTFPSYNPPMYEEYMTKSIRKEPAYPPMEALRIKRPTTWIL